MTYAQPKHLDEALSLLAADSWSILSGGTDWYPAVLERPMAGNVLDIHALDELRHISVDAGQVKIGAGVTWSEIIKADLPAAFNGLKMAAHEVGSVQIQNRATLAGNLCNASPAADGVPPLLTLGAEVELTSQTGTRQLALSDFIVGNRHIALEPDEMLSSIIIPAHGREGRSTFLKLGARNYLVISISMVAARLVCDKQGVVSDAAVSVGSCSLVATRLRELETVIVGKRLTADLPSLVRSGHLASLSPIEDVRSTAQYRQDASLELVRRTLTTLVSEFS